jgi:hypothetical protein
MTAKAMSIAVDRQTQRQAIGYRCKETGEYAPLLKWAESFAAKFGCTVQSAKVAIIAAAKHGTQYHGLSFERVERRR